MADAAHASFATTAVHAGETVDAATGALVTPVVRSAPFVFPDLEALEAHCGGHEVQFEYSRTASPTARVAEQKIAALEGADEALVVASGMAAVSTTMLALLSAGDHVLLADNAYKRSLTFGRDSLPRFGIEGELFDAQDAVAGVRAAMRPTTRLVFVEAPSNPNGYVPDLPALAEVCHAHDCLLAVDATLASPYNLRPLEHGADLSLHSATKYLAGHNDLLAGVIAGSSTLIDRLRVFHRDLGAVLPPDECYLLIRGLKTLAVRVARQNETALRLARWLAEQPQVRAVHYAGLADHPDHATATRLMDGYGGLLSFDLAADHAGVQRFFAALALIPLATSLGGVESMVLHLRTIFQGSLSAADLDRFGLTGTLVRFSVGLEDPDDLQADLAQALAAI